MKSRVSILVVGALAVAVLAPGAFGQGGNGRGFGQGRGMGYGMGRGMGNGMGNGMGCGMGRFAAGGQNVAGPGWWTRVNPKTPVERALVNRVAELHKQMWSAAQRLSDLRGAGADAAEIADQQRMVNRLRSEIQTTMRDNAASLRGMGINCGGGYCGGRGPGGRGGFGPRDGSGPNPNCPLKK